MAIITIGFSAQNKKFSVDESNEGKLTISDSSSNSVTLTLKKVEYDKSVNEPGSMTLLFSAGSADVDNLNNVLTSFIQNGDTFTLMVNDGSCETTVNKGYYLHNARVVSRSIRTDTGTSVTRDVKMFCYSPDKKWTFKPGCQAWSGQSFGADILKGKVSAHYANLNFLKCKDGEELKDLRQAYLVQYNEPFFDFAQRTANRCGEFLYYENGDVHYGLKDDWRKNDSYSELSGNIPTYNICLDEDLKDGTVSYSFDVMSPKGTDSDAVYNSPVGDDSFYAKPDDVCSGRLEALGVWILADIAFSGLQGNSLSDVIEKGITALTTDLVGGGFADLRAQEDYKRQYTKKYTDKTGIADVYHYKEDKIDNSLLLNTFYSRVREAEKQVTEQKVELDWQEYFPTAKTTDTKGNQTIGGAYLGNLVQWGTGKKKDGTTTNNKYVISRMYGYIDMQESTDPDISHKTEMVPLYEFAKATKAGTGDDNPLSIPLPPLDSRPHYRSAAPQEAVVTAADDPTFMGRVRVKFAWQNDKVQSPWIRVSTPFAGRGEAGGICMTPCVDSHVILNFLHDNIEMPYVDGGLFTKDNKPDPGLRATVFSQLLPSFATQTITSRNGTGITFQDYDGARGWGNFVGGMIPAFGAVWSLISLKDFSKDGVSPNSTMILRDKNGFFEINMSAIKRSVDIKSPLGNVSISAFTGITISAPNGNINIEGKNVSIKAGNKLTLQSGLNIHDKKWEDESGLIGGIATRIAAKTAAATLKGATGIDLTNICDMSFYRAALEVVLRPVDGTLDIESKRNVIMTAGKGRVTIPMSNSSKNYTKFKDNYKDYAYLVLIDVFQKIKEAVNGLEPVKNAWAAYSEAFKKVSDGVRQIGDDQSIIEHWDDYIDGMTKPNQLKDIGDKIIDYQVVDDDINEAHDYGLKEIRFKAEVPPPLQENADDDNHEQEERIEDEDVAVRRQAWALVSSINDCIRAKSELLRAITGHNLSSEGLPQKETFNRKLVCRVVALNNKLHAIFFTDEQGNQMTELGKKLKIIINRDNTIKNKNIQVPKVSSDEQAGESYKFSSVDHDLNLKRLIYQFITENQGIKSLFDPQVIVVENQNGQNQEVERDLALDNFWGKLREPKPKPKGWKDIVMGGLKDVAGLNTDDLESPSTIRAYSNLAGDVNAWEVTNRGGILFSNSAGKTTRLNEDTGQWEQFDNLNVELVNQWMQGNTASLDIIQKVPDAQQNGQANNQ